MTAARDLLRSTPRADLHRKELAITAGVTPALISYYFQDKGSLIEAVVRPVIEDYLADLQTLLRTGAPPASKLRSLILFLIRLSQRDGQLIETYVNHVKRQRRSSASDFLVQARHELLAFVSECEEAQIIQSSNVAFTVAALWGVCRTVAHIPEVFSEPRSLEAEVLERMQTDLVLKLLTQQEIIREQSDGAAQPPR